MWTKRHFKNLVEMSGAALDLVLKLSRAKFADGRFFDVVIPGGGTPATLFSMLAAETRIPWEMMRIFWTDERFVPDSDPRSNYAAAENIFIGKIHIPCENVFRITTGFPSAHDAATDYDRRLRTLFGPGGPSFDLVIAGMGPDGHFASLFPGSPVLLESAKFAAAVPAPANCEPKVERISLTSPVFNAAKKIVFMIQRGKEEIFDKSAKKSAAGSSDISLPVSFLDRGLDLECLIAK